MKHIRYLRSTETLCERPDNLGGDLVVADPGGGVSCRECSALLMAHNKKSYEAELAAMHNKRAGMSYERALGQVGLIIAGFTSAFWIGFFLVLWWLLYG